MDKKVKIIIGILSVVVVISMSMIGLTIYNNLKDKEDDSANNNYFVEQNTTPEADEMYKKYLKKLEENIRKCYNKDANGCSYYEVFSVMDTYNPGFSFFNFKLDRNLKFYLDEKILISDNVLKYYVIPEGPAGYQYLYLLKTDGSIYRILLQTIDEEWNWNDNQYEKLPYKNIISINHLVIDCENEGGHNAVLTDIEGNLYSPYF